jgi:hypothetical protein
MQQAPLGRIEGAAPVALRRLPRQSDWRPVTGCVRTMGCTAPAMSRMSPLAPDGTEVVVRADPRAGRLAEGEAVRLRFDTTRLHLFDPETVVAVSHGA